LQYELFRVKIRCNFSGDDCFPLINMHCPSCGQQQVSEEIKFCSRCGFPLVLVSEILAHGGFLPQLAELHRSKTFFTRRNGVVFSVIWCLFFLLIMAPLWGIANVEELAGASAVIGIFGGLILLIASLTLLKKPVVGAPEALPGQAMPAGLYSRPVGQLPQQQSEPVSTYMPPRAGSWRAPDTGDLRPGSVTEGTTKLLRKEAEDEQ
jgi:hypothetical protein